MPWQNHEVETEILLNNPYHQTKSAAPFGTALEKASIEASALVGSVTTASTTATTAAIFARTGFVDLDVTTVEIGAIE